MKKLMMFAAAMTIVGSAFADCEDVERDCVMVYNVKINLKTVMGKGKAVGKSICEDSTTEGTGPDCIRFPRYPYLLVGYIVNCECACDAVLNDGSVVYLWNTKQKSWLDKVTTSDDSFVHVLGNKNTAEMYWSFTAEDSLIGELELALAGFGTYSRTAWTGGLFTSFSGAAVGLLKEPKCLTSGEDCAVASYWECADLTTLVDDDPSIMYGPFAIKFNKAASVAMSKPGGILALDKHLPPWAAFDATLGD